MEFQIMAKKRAKSVVTNPKASLLSGGLQNGPALDVGSNAPAKVEVVGHSATSLNKAAGVKYPKPSNSL